MLVRPPKQIITTKPFTSRLGYEVCKDYLFFAPELDIREEDTTIYDSLKRPLLGEDLPFDGSTTSKFFKSRICVDNTFEDTGLKVTEQDINTLAISAGSMYTYTGGYLTFETFTLDTAPLAGSDYWTAIYTLEDTTGYTEIATKADLDAIRDDLDGNYVLTADITFIPTDFQIGGDYYNDGSGWTPIGTSGAPFAGKLNGGGYTITGIEISAANQSYLGLFGYCNECTIRDLDLSGFIISGRGYMGALSGYVASSTIDNCTCDTIDLDWDYDPCGGMIGYFVESTITNSSATNITVSNSFAGTTSGYGEVAGGFIGYVYNICSISMCYSSTVTIGITATTYNTTNIGGFIGKIWGGLTSIIEKCYSASVDISGNIRVQGGFAGSNNSVINTCYSSASLQSDLTSESGVYKNISGGFVGTVSTGSNIANCYSSGTSELQTVGSNGGFVGSSVSTVFTNCYSTVELTGGSVNRSGGFSGRSSTSSLPNPNIISCFWDTEVSGILTSFGGTGKNTDQLQGDQSIYTDWDESIWVFESAQYPQFLYSNGVIYFVTVFNNDTIDVEKITTPDVDEYGTTEGYYCGLLNQDDYNGLLLDGFPKEALMILGIVYLDGVGQIVRIEEKYADVFDRTESLFPANLYSLNGGVLRNSGWYENW